MKTGDEWRKVGDQFAAIGERFKEHYDQVESGDPAEESSVDEVRSALRTLGDALDTVFTAVGQAFRDPALRNEAKEAAGAIATALGATFNELSDEVRHLVESKTAGTPTEAGAGRYGWGHHAPDRTAARWWRRDSTGRTAGPATTGRSARTDATGHTAGPTGIAGPTGTGHTTGPTGTPRPAAAGNPARAAAAGDRAGFGRAARTAPTGTPRLTRPATPGPISTFDPRNGAIVGSVDPATPADHGGPISPQPRVGSYLSGTLQPRVGGVAQQRLGPTERNGGR